MNERKKNKGKKEKEHTLEPKSQNAKEPGPKRKEVKKLERNWRMKKREQRNVKQEPTCM